MCVCVQKIWLRGALSCTHTTPYSGVRRALLGKFYNIYFDCSALNSRWTYVYKICTHSTIVRVFIYSNMFTSNDPLTIPKNALTPLMTLYLLWKASNTSKCDDLYPLESPVNSSWMGPWTHWACSLNSTSAVQPCVTVVCVD